MNADCAFFTGRSHFVCQDYAIASFKKDLAYAIISDGCSGSEDTDFGARLLARAAAQALDNFKPYSEEFFLHVASVARNQAISLGLDPRSINATLLTLTPKAGRMIRGSIYGDGFVVVKYRSNEYLEVVSTSFSSKDAEEFPSYPSYMLDAENESNWAKINPNGMLEDRYILDIKNIKKIEYADANIKCRPICTINNFRWLDVAVYIDDIEWIAMLSDGVHTFMNQPADSSGGRVEDIEVLSHILDFKGFKGEFVKRQTNWFMRTFAKRGWYHGDDLSIAAFYVGDE